MIPMTTENMLRNRSGKSRVLLVDDHPLVRRGVADVIAHEADLEICGEAADVAEAMQEVERTQPDLVRGRSGA